MSDLVPSPLSILVQREELYFWRDYLLGRWAQQLASTQPDIQMVRRIGHYWSGQGGHGLIELGVAAISTPQGIMDLWGCSQWEAILINHLSRTVQTLGLSQYEGFRLDLFPGEKRFSPGDFLQQEQHALSLKYGARFPEEMHRVEALIEEIWKSQ